MRRFFHTLLLAFVAVAADLRADDLDTLLTQPPGVSLTADDAKRRIEMLRAFVADHPDRAGEIEAYLIPFVRVAEPPPPPPTPTPAPPPAKARPLLLIKGPDGTASTMRALSFRKQGAVIIVTGERNTRAVLQATSIAGELPWFGEKDIKSGAVNLNDIAGRYEAYAMVVPSLSGELKREAGRFRAMVKAKEDVVEKERAAVEARVVQATEPVYNPGSGYTASSLAKLLLDAEKVRNELPQSSERIDAWSAPFREHFAKLLAGFSHVGGKWVSNAELARQAREKQQQDFLNGLDYEVDAAALPADAVGKLVSPFVIKGCLAVAAGIVVLVLGRRKIYARIAGAVLVALAPLAMATTFFLATRDPGLSPAGIPVSDDQQIVDALSQAAGLGDSATASHRISDAGLNGFLARHVRIGQTAGAADAPKRQSMVVRLLPGKVAIFEMIRARGLDWIVRLDLAMPAGGGVQSLTLESARIGALECPKPLAAELWNNLKPQLGKILAAGRITDHFVVQSPIAGAVELKPAAKTDQP
jgi:hypothetical protein